MNYDFTHQFINIPGYQEITLEIYKKIPNDFYKQHGFIGVNTKFFSNIIGFREMVETFGPWQNVSQIALVNILPDKHIDEFAIHTDVGHKQKLALNLPVYNCNDVYTAFYKPQIGRAHV